MLSDQTKKGILTENRLLYCNVGFLIRSTRHHIAAVSVNVSTPKLPVYMYWQFRHGTARTQPGEAGTIEAASI